MSQKRMIDQEYRQTLYDRDEIKNVYKMSKER